MIFITSSNIKLADILFKTLFFSFILIFFSLLSKNTEKNIFNFINILVIKEKSGQVRS